MRIVAGSRKGHRIAAPRGVVTRPTGDRVREAAFSLIGPVEDAHVLDLFAGSGAMGLEALSRGAARCVFVEQDREACHVIERNVEKLGLTGAIVLRRGAVEALREEKERGRRYELVLADPPYDDWEWFAGPLSTLVPPLLSEGALVVVETEARTEPKLPLDLVTSRRYGSARISVITTP